MMRPDRQDVFCRAKTLIWWCLVSIEVTIWAFTSFTQAQLVLQRKLPSRQAPHIMQALCAVLAMCCCYAPTNMSPTAIPCAPLPPPPCPACSCEPCPLQALDNPNPLLGQPAVGIKRLTGPVLPGYSYSAVFESDSPWLLFLKPPSDRLPGRVMAHTLQGVPAIAVSLDNYKALTPEGFMAGAAYVVALIKVSNHSAFYIKPSCEVYVVPNLSAHCCSNA